MTITATPSPAMYSSARDQVLGPVADDLDHRRLDADLAQALGQPRAVAVGDDPGEDLGPGDQDARPGPRRARAHAQRGCLDGGSGVLPVGCSRNPIDDADGLTVTLAPLTFICTELLPSVSSSFDAVSVGIVWPALKI